MKKVLSLVLSICICMGITACNQPDAEISSAEVTTQIYALEKGDEAISPELTLSSDGTFGFPYDVLSSYYPIGTYEEADGILTATTDDGRYHYIFERVDEKTLKFVAEQSSDVSLTDPNLGVEIADGDSFVLQEEVSQ